MEKVTVGELKQEIKCMLKDEFVAKVACGKQGIEICFLNGQRFILQVEALS